jgi:hypothetical protein
MPEYRAYIIGGDGHFVNFEGMICRDDGEAIAKAKQLVDGHDVELWQCERFVKRLDSQNKRDGSEPTKNPGEPWPKPSKR